jgi:hypothetical protein
VDVVKLGKGLRCEEHVFVQEVLPLETLSQTLIVLEDVNGRLVALFLYVTQAFFELLFKFLLIFFCLLLYLTDKLVSHDNSSDSA